MLISLSGGGFRASLYHAGVLRALEVAGELDVDHISKVKICAVSGGTLPAILWEHFNLVRNLDPWWPERQLLSFITSCPRFGGKWNWKLRQPFNRWSWAEKLRRWHEAVTQSASPKDSLSSLRISLLETLDFRTGDIWVYSRDGFYKVQKELFKGGGFATTRFVGDFAESPAWVGLAASTAFLGYFNPIVTETTRRSEESDRVREVEFVDAGLIDNRAFYPFFSFFEKDPGGEYLGRGAKWFFSDAGSRMPILGTSDHRYVEFPKVDRLRLHHRIFRMTGDLAQLRYSTAALRFLHDFVEIDARGVMIGILPYGEKPWQTTSLFPDEESIALLQTHLHGLTATDAICIMAAGAQAASRSLGVDSGKRSQLKTDYDAFLQEHKSEG